MNCCESCSRTAGWTYVLDGDGDGIEFMVETAHLVGGGHAESTVVFVLSGQC